MFRRTWPSTIGARYYRLEFDRVLKFQLNDPICDDWVAMWNEVYEVIGDGA